MAKHLPYPQQKQLETFITDKITTEGCEEGHCKYLNGYNDTKIAKEFGCTPSNVRGIRTQIFGKVKKEGKPKTVVADLYEQLLERVKFIEDQLGIKFERAS